MFGSCVVCGYQRFGFSVAGLTDMGEGVVCRACVRNSRGPGRYERYWNDVRALATVLALESLSFGMADDVMGDFAVTGSFHALFGRFVLSRSAYGFVEFEEFGSVEAAGAAWERAYDDGEGADSSDAFIGFDRGAWHVSFDGSDLGSFPRLSRAKAAVSLACRKHGYYPSVWLEGERGGFTSVSVW